MGRRKFLSIFSAALLPAAVYRGAAAANGRSAGGSELDEIRKHWRSLLPPGAPVAAETGPLRRPEAEWRHVLEAEQYRVLREEGTEPPFSSLLNNEHRPGVFVCAGCGLPLFTSRMKFDSGTGWPSFFTSIPDHLATRRDFRLLLPRTEYHCVRCGGHQGHVFDDGPPPTGERWCNNGVALRFLPA